MSDIMDDILKVLGENSSETASIDIANESMGDEVIPIILMVDRSASMGSGNPAPIDAVNEAVASFVDELANPTLLTLKNNQHRIWVMAISYSDGVTIDLPFTSAVNLPTMPPFIATGATCMGQAMEVVTEELFSFFGEVHNSSSSLGQAFIFNITDGVPTDMDTNDNLWKKTQKLLHFLFDPNNTKNAPMINGDSLTPNSPGFINMHHFIASGSDKKSFEIMKNHSGNFASIWALDKDPTQFADLIKMIGKSITASITDPNITPADYMKKHGQHVVSLYSSVDDDEDAKTIAVA